MAWWLTVYCRRPVSTISAKQLETLISGADYFTLAEDYDVDDALVSPAVKALTVSQDLEVSFGDARPIVVHLWKDAGRVAEELAEMHQVRSPPASQLERLETTKEIVGIELGFSHLENMGVVIAYEIARHLAQLGEGLIVDDDDRWQVVDDGAFVELD